MILIELYRLCGFWGIGSLFTLNITEIAKFEIGRLRPHFIAACNITLTEVNFLPLRQKLLKTLQNEAIFPLITMNVLIYASNLFN